MQRLTRMGVGCWHVQQQYRAGGQTSVQVCRVGGPQAGGGTCGRGRQRVGRYCRLTMPYEPEPSNHSLPSGRLHSRMSSELMIEACTSFSCAWFGSTPPLGPANLFCTHQQAWGYVCTSYAYEFPVHSKKMGSNEATLKQHFDE